MRAALAAAEEVSGSGARAADRMSPGLAVQPYRSGLGCRAGDGVTGASAAVARHLTRYGLVEAQPEKRPKSSYIRFEAATLNQTWQSDFTPALYRSRRDVGRLGPGLV